MTPYEIAQRYVGVVREVPGDGRSHPFIQWCYTLCGIDGETDDALPWCSAFAQHPFWELRLPRSKSARARSWLTVGVPVALADAKPGYDVVILQRGEGAQPGPEVIDAPGHVGLFAGLEGGAVLILGGNQGDAVTIARFPVVRILGIRRCQ